MGHKSGKGVHSVAGRVAERGFEIYVAMPSHKNAGRHGWYDCCHVDYEHCIYSGRFCGDSADCEIRWYDNGIVLFIQVHEEESCIVVPRDEENDGSYMPWYMQEEDD